MCILRKVLININAQNITNTIIIYFVIYQLRKIYYWLMAELYISKNSLIIKITTYQLAYIYIAHIKIMTLYFLNKERIVKLIK